MANEILPDLVLAYDSVQLYRASTHSIMPCVSKRFDDAFSHVGQSLEHTLSGPDHAGRGTLPLIIYQEMVLAYQQFLSAHSLLVGRQRALRHNSKGRQDITTTANSAGIRNQI